MAGTVAALSSVAPNCFVVSVSLPEPRELYVQCDTAARCSSWVNDINDIVSEAYMARPTRKPPGTGQRGLPVPFTRPAYSLPRSHRRRSAAPREPRVRCARRCAGAEEGGEDADEDDPDPEELKANSEFSRKLSARVWGEHASNLPSLMTIREDSSPRVTPSPSPGTLPACRSTHVLALFSLSGCVAGRVQAWERRRRVCCPPVAPGAWCPPRRSSLRTQTRPPTRHGFPLR